MKKIVINNNNKNKNKNLIVSPLNLLNEGEGTYRVITKSQVGFMRSSDVEAKSAIDAFRRFKPKTIQSIAFISEDNFPITVFARAGKKIFASECFLSEVTVGDINQDLSNTALYCQDQYKAVNAKTWKCKAYVMNEEESK